MQQQNTNTTLPNTPPETQPPTNTPPPSNTPPQQQTPSNFTLDETVRELKEARTEAQNLRKRMKEIEDAQNVADQQKQKEQGQYKELAEKHEAKVKELEPKVAELVELATMINQQIETETKDWPASVKALAPGSDAPIAQRLAWRTKGQVIIAEMANTARGQAPGNGQNPPAIGGNQQSQAGVDELKQRYQVQRGNPF